MFWLGGQTGNYCRELLYNVHCVVLRLMKLIPVALKFHMLWPSFWSSQLGWHFVNFDTFSKSF